MATALQACDMHATVYVSSEAWQQRFKHVVYVAIALSFVIYMGVGIPGLLQFGDLTKDMPCMP